MSKPPYPFQRLRQEVAAAASRRDAIEALLMQPPYDEYPPSGDWVEDFINEITDLVVEKPE